MATRRFQNVPLPKQDNLVPTVMALSAAVGYITAQTQPKIASLPPSATTADIINKVNEILARLQGT